jgi:gluconolactonase
MPRVGAALLFVCLTASAQDFSDIKVEKVAAGFTFTEGPVWSREGFLLFSDVPTNRIMKLATGAPTVFREQSGAANGNAIDDRGRLYTCEGSTKRVTRTDKNGKIEVLAERYNGKRFNAPNDIVVSKNYHVYFTDPAFGRQSEGRELDFYGVYHITPKGELSIFAKPQGRPNGITLSPNGRILYVANSDEKNIRGYDIGRDGVPSNERVVIQNVDGPPDGIRADEKGNIYVTANAVSVYSPEGKLIGTIPVPETPANCAFGEGDMQSLFITARTSVYRVRLNVKGSVQY